LENIENVQVSIQHLKSPGKSIPASALFCINTGGTTYDGKPLTKTVNVTKGEVQALWCGVDVPATILPSTYTGKATFSIRWKASKTITIAIKVNTK
jgi:hypothetical protein